ncbi:MAG: polysaccharide pyruvyl transferase family protein, partial [Oceanococcaceae bacterium]
VLAIQDSLRTRLGSDLQITNLPVNVLCQNQLPPQVARQYKYPTFIHELARVAKGRSLGRLLREINSADLLVIGGGGVYMQALLPLSSIGCLAAKASLHSVRDQPTQDMLSKLGVGARLICDPAAFLGAPKREREVGREGLSIGLNIAAHGWARQEELLDQVVAHYAQFAHDLSNKGGVVFDYFMHHPGEHNVVRKLTDAGVKFRAIHCDAAKGMAAAYAQVDLVVSMMLHSAILAFGAGVPTISVGYDQKNQPFMALSGQDTRYLDVLELDASKLISMTMGALCENDAVVRELIQQKQRLQAESERFFDEVAALA